MGRFGGDRGGRVAAARVAAARVADARVAARCGAIRCARVLVLVAPLALAAPRAVGAPPAEPPGVRGSREQVAEAWLASDAAVVGVYHGIDSTLGPQYHVVQAEAVWMGTPAPGRIVFKAPRGVRLERGTKSLLFFWERLAGAPDSYLEESKSRYADAVWERIGPDSIAVYLLPFPNYSYPFSKDKLILRGQSAFPTEIEIDKLRKSLEDYEATLQPDKLYAASDVVLRARVEKADVGTRTEYGQIIERWVLARFRTLENVKATAPDTLSLRFVSVPRSPRFRQGEEVLLFLKRGPSGLFLEQGKRAVLHVVQGEVLEAGRPLAEFLKTLRGS